MICPGCNQPNDSDAVFCEHCGKALNERLSSAWRLSRVYLYTLFLLPIFAAVLGVGYYKFILPHGVVAVVNGEDIKRSELDAALSLERKKQEDLYGPSVFDGDRRKELLSRLRYEVLTELIKEHLLLQEAHKAGVTVSDADVTAAEAQVQSSSAMDKATFDRYISAHYGDEGTYHEWIRRKLIIDRLISGSVAAGTSDPQAAQQAVRRWFDDLYSHATVRIALAEQWSAAGRGCCRRSGSQNAEQTGRARSGCSAADGSSKQFLDKFVHSN